MLVCELCFPCDRQIILVFSDSARVSQKNKVSINNNFDRSLGQQLLARGSLTITLVGSLALYHQSVLTDRVALEYQRWRANRTDHLIASKILACGNKIILSKTDGMDREEKGEKMRLCWLKFFRSNKI